MVHSNARVLIFMCKIKMIIFIILVIIALVYIFRLDFTEDKMTLGVTFSQLYAEELGLNWQEVYLAFLDDLGARSFRLIAYWPQLEKEEGKFDFSSLDWQLAELEKRGGRAILVIGRRLPRWPECHEPSWVANLEEKAKQEKILLLLTEVVNHYKDSQVIESWQVENEPLLTLFGKCPAPDKNFLSKEVAQVRALDSRPIIITDSGELSLWLRTPRYADILGTTMYRVVWNKYLGYFKHLYPPAFYYWRSLLAQKLFKIDKVITSELQAEPWVPEGKFIKDISLEKQFESIDLDRLRENINFARRSGFSEAYLWGVEWWYWLKKQGEESFWEEMRNDF